MEWARERLIYPRARLARTSVIHRDGGVSERKVSPSSHTINEPVLRCL